jgi:hypothetical protein
MAWNITVHHDASTLEVIQLLAEQEPAVHLLLLSAARASSLIHDGRCGPIIRTLRQPAEHPNVREMIASSGGGSIRLIQDHPEFGKLLHSSRQLLEAASGDSGIRTGDCNFYSSSVLIIAAASKPLFLSNPSATEIISSSSTQIIAHAFSIAALRA